MNFSFQNLSAIANPDEDSPVCSSDVRDSEKCFKAIFRNSPSKLVLIFICLLFTIVNIALPYGIIWYERFGTDNKRTLMNKLVKIPAFFLTVQF